MIGIIGAMDIEVEKLKTLMLGAREENICGVSFVSGTLWGRETVVAVSGVGKVNAAACTQAMIIRYSPDFIINSGVAGCLAPDLDVLDMVIASGVVQHDMDTSPLGDPIGFISGINKIVIPCSSLICEKLLSAASESGVKCRSGIIASGDRFVASKEEKNRIVSQFDAVSCEMEGGAIGHVCYKCGVEFAVIRSMSDKADGEASVSYNDLKQIASDNLVKVLKNFYNTL